MKRPLLFPPISTEHAAALGYVAAHWSLIEEFLGTLQYQLLGLHAIPGHAATAEVSTLQRIGTISALLNLTGKKEWIEEWEDIIVILDNLRNRRNDAIHSTWMMVGLDHRYTRRKARGRLTVKGGTMKSEDLVQLSEEMLDLFWKLTEFTVPLLQAGVSKIINQFHPPGWPVSILASNSQAPDPSPKSQPRNPRRVRKQRRKQQRRGAEQTSS
jgi:hypothetical protein